MYQKPTSDKIVRLCKIIYFDHELFVCTVVYFFRDCSEIDWFKFDRRDCWLSYPVCGLKKCEKQHFMRHKLNANGYVSRRFLLPALDQRVEVGKVAKSYLVNETYFYNLQLCMRKILLSSTGSEKLRIRLY